MAQGKNSNARRQRRERRAAARVARKEGCTSGQSQKSVGARFAGLASRGALVVIGLSLLVLVSYFPALSGGFIWDDVIFTDEPVIHRWSGLWSIWLSPSDMLKEAHYWPITYTTFWLEHKLWGLEPFGYHLFNVLLHAVNTVLVWRLMLKLAVPGALAIAAVFAVHPLHVESVAWIIERKDLLSALFYLSAVLMWIRFTEAPHPWRYSAALVLFTAGMLSKSIVVTLPAALLIWHWWKYGRISANDILRLLPFFLIGFVITVGDLVYYTSRGESLALSYSAVERLLIASRALWFYVGKLLWPDNLAVIYPSWEIHADDLLGWSYVVAAAGLGAMLWFLRRRFRGPLAGTLFFVVTLSPVLGFVGFSYMRFSLVADRFQYLAGIGVMAVLIGGVAWGANRLPDTLRRGTVGVLIVILALLATLTWRQAGIYQDRLTFFSHIIELNPNATGAHFNLSGALFKAGRLEEGYAAALIAIEENPGAVGAHANIGHTMLLKGRFDEAEASLRRTLELDSDNWQALRSMAEMRRKQGRYQEAAEWFRKMLVIEPSNAAIHADLGVLLYESGSYQEALVSMHRARELNPGLPNLSALHLLAGRALQALGQFDAAGQRFLEAARSNPGDPIPLADLSLLHSEQQRLDEADEYLRQALVVAHKDIAALQNVAEIFRSRGRHQEAIKSYRAVLAIAPELAGAHAGMGDAFYRLGRYEEAIESLDRSVDLHPRPPVATPRLVLMGKASEKLGRADAAVAYYERAVEIDPENTIALEHLAITYFTGKRYDEALALYRVVLELKPESALAHLNLGSTLYRLGRPDEALMNFERALVLDPELETARESAERLRRTLSKDRP